MAKLKCDLHKQRVFAIGGKFIHRGNWGDVCKSPTATIGDSTYTAEKINLHGMKITSEEGSNPNRARQLIKELFSG